jgi:hypothetical protein
MEEIPKTPVQSSRALSVTPLSLLAPGTVKLFNTPLTTSGNRGTKRSRNNKSTPLNNTPNSKSLRADAEEQLIIIDYNPNEVMEITEDGTNTPIIITKKVNNVESVDRYFYYPSSFICSFEGKPLKLCIHKFSHNNPISLTFSPSYVLHPNVIKLLTEQQLAPNDIKNIILAFKSLDQGQTLLVNLEVPVEIKANDTMTNTNSENFTIKRTTPVIIGDSNSVVLYNPEIKYGRNNNNNNNNKRNNFLHQQPPNDTRHKLTTTEIKYYDRFLGDKQENSAVIESGMGMGFGGIVTAGLNKNFEWSNSMFTPPLNVMDRAEPELAANGNIPTQILENNQEEAEYRDDGTPTQILENNQEEAEYRAANGNIPTQIEEVQLTQPPLPGTPLEPTQRPSQSPGENNTGMLIGGNINKKNRKQSKKMKRKHRKTKKTKTTQKS